MTPTGRPIRRRRWRDERGYALLTVCLVLLVLALLGAASVMYTNLDLRSTAHYDTGNRAFSAAEAGVLHALSTMNATGVVDFENEVVDRWDTVFGSATRSIPTLPSLTYRVTVAADPANPTDLGTLTSTGFAPLSARRSIIVQLDKGDFNGSPGAIHLASDDVNSRFNGNAFDIDGNDHNMLGQPVANGPVKPGISTRSDSVNNGVVGSLSDGQMDNVKGLGFSADPLTPSVLPTGGPGVTDLDDIVNRLMALPGVVNTGTPNFNGNDTFGTVEQPQVTRMTAGDVRLNGNASGAGILIVDGSITISGTLDFIGWIIVRGDTVIESGTHADDTTIQGNATILGALWTGDLSITVGGSAIINYCDSCMRLADNMNGPGGGILPRPMRVVSWREVL